MITWTTAPPTKQGWYFARILPNEKVLLVSIVGFQPFLSVASSHGVQDGYPADVNHFNLKEWAGPLVMPIDEGTQE